VCGKLRAATILLPQVQSAAAYRRREARRCFGLHASPHALQPQARLPRSGALPAAQASLTALPDELLRGILQCAWADRPPHDAAEEVRAAVGLASVCRRTRELLRKTPLPLALDFSARPLGAAQRRWLFKHNKPGFLVKPPDPICVVAALFDSDDALWEQPLGDLDSFLARHSGTLLRLSGVPLELVACVTPEEPPALDLSGLRLIKLGVDCSELVGDTGPPLGYRVRGRLGRYIG